MNQGKIEQLEALFDERQRLEMEGATKVAFPTNNEPARFEATFGFGSLQACARPLGGTICGLLIGLASLSHVSGPERASGSTPKSDLRALRFETQSTAFLSGSLELTTVQTGAAPLQSLRPECEPSVNAEPQAFAWIALDISAPCDPNARIDITEGPFQVSVKTDGQGEAFTLVPALLEAPEIQVWIGDHPMVEVQSAGWEIDRYARATVLSHGVSGIELHVFEDGADYGDQGHIWAEAPQSISQIHAGEGGFLTVLGDPDLPNAQLATVYTRPLDVDAEISIEVPVTAANCGQSVSGKTILSGPDLLLGDLVLDMTMPPCDAVGSIVVLGSP